MEIDFNDLSEIKHKEIEFGTIIYYPEVYEKLCYYPYPNHLKGCPNINKCRNLNVPYFGNLIYRLNYNYYYLVYIDFNFKRYKELRKISNPEFFNTEDRIKCVLYYQNSLKYVIKKYIELIYKQNKDFYVFGFGSGLNLSFQEPVASMEAVGINVFSTMKLNKIPFEIKPVNKIVFCSLLLSKYILDFKQKYKEVSIFNYLK